MWIIRYLQYDIQQYGMRSIWFHSRRLVLFAWFIWIPTASYETTNKFN
jgi:hypothetical protein